MRVLVVGHITKDILVVDGERKEQPGGVVYYFSLVMKELGAEVDVLTKLNNRDIYLISDLENNNINVISILSDNTTVFVNSYLRRDLNKREQRIESVADPFSFEDFKDLPKDYDLIHFGPLTSLEFPINLYEKLRNEFPNSIFSLDIQGHLRFIENNKIILKQIDYQFLKYLDILKLNEEELLTLTKENKYILGLDKLSKYINEIVLTLGSEGSIIYENGNIYRIPVFIPRYIKDVTGCGDTYIASYLYMRLKRFHPQSSALFASLLSGLKVETFGVKIPFKELSI